MKMLILLDHHCCQRILQQQQFPQNVVLRTHTHRNEWSQLRCEGEGTAVHLPLAYPPKTTAANLP